MGNEFCRVDNGWSGDGFVESVGLAVTGVYLFDKKNTSKINNI